MLTLDSSSLICADSRPSDRLSTVLSGVAAPELEPVFLLERENQLDPDLAGFGGVLDADISLAGLSTGSAGR